MTTTKIALPVTAVERSENAKIGEVSATYVSQESCPKTFPMRGRGHFYCHLGLA